MVPARIPFWKRENARNRKKRLIRLIVLIVLVFIVVNVAVKAPGVVRLFTQPFDELPGTGKDNASLDFTYRSNFFFLSYLSEEIIFDAALVSYEPKDQKVTFVHFDLKNNDSLRKKINSLFRDGGIEKAQKYISLGLSVPVDRYLAAEKPDFSPDYISGVQNDLTVPSVFSTFFSLDEVFGKGLKTNMNSKEYLDFILKIRSSNYSEVNYFKVSAGDLPNRSTSTIFENDFLDNMVLDEGAAVAVKNSSGEPGLASVLSRYLTNLGANVVVIDSGEEIVDESLIINKENKKAVIGRIQTLFDIKKKEKYDLDFPGNLLIIIGKDAVERLTLR